MKLNKHYQVILKASTRRSSTFPCIPNSWRRLSTSCPMNCTICRLKCVLLRTRWALSRIINSIYRGYNPSYPFIRSFIGVDIPFVTRLRGLPRSQHCVSLWVCLCDVIRSLRTQGIQADAVDFNVYHWVPLSYILPPKSSLLIESKDTKRKQNVKHVQNRQPYLIYKKTRTLKFSKRTVRTKKQQPTFGVSESRKKNGHPGQQTIHH